MKTPIKNLKGIEIVEVKGNIAVIRGYVEEGKGTRQITRELPLSCLKEEYRKENISENSRFGSVINWKGNIIEKNVLNGRFLEFYLIYEKGCMNLSPAYQRGFVWTPDQKKEYIMALLKSRAEIEPTFIQEYREKNEHYEVVDGKQRMHTIFDFINNGFTIGDNIFFSDLSADDMMKILNFDVRYTRFISFTDDIPVDFRLELFLEINTKGTEMSKEQINKVKKMTENYLTNNENMI